MAIRFQKPKITTVAAPDVTVNTPQVVVAPPSQAVTVEAPDFTAVVNQLQLINAGVRLPKRFELTNPVLQFVQRAIPDFADALFYFYDDDLVPNPDALFDTLDSVFGLWVIPKPDPSHVPLISGSDLPANFDRDTANWIPWGNQEVWFPGYDLFVKLSGAPVIKASNIGIYAGGNHYRWMFLDGADEEVFILLEFLFGGLAGPTVWQCSGQVANLSNELTTFTPENRVNQLSQQSYRRVPSRADTVTRILSPDSTLNSGVYSVDGHNTPQKRLLYWLNLHCDAEVITTPHSGIP